VSVKVSSDVADVMSDETSFKSTIRQSTRALKSV